MSSPYPQVVVGTDGSVTAQRAVRRAATFAHAFGVPLLVTTAYTRVRPEELGPLSEQARLPDNIAAFGYIGAQETAQDGAAIATRAYPDLEVDVGTPEGDPAEALLEFTAQRADSLLVIGSQGLGASGLFALGNVPHKITHHAVGDIMVVSTSKEREEDAPHRLLVGFDGSRTAKLAVERAAAVAKGLNASVTMLAVGREDWATDVLAEGEAMLKSVGVPVVTERQEGDPATVLVQRAADFDALVLGNRGMTGARRFLLGSVPNKVSHHVTADLLIVKTT